MFQTKPLNLAMENLSETKRFASSKISYQKGISCNKSNGKTSEKKPRYLRNSSEFDLTKDKVEENVLNEVNMRCARVITVTSPMNSLIKRKNEKNKQCIWHRKKKINKENFVV